MQTVDISLARTSGIGRTSVTELGDPTKASPSCQFLSLQRNMGSPEVYTNMRFPKKQHSLF